MLASAALLGNQGGGQFRAVSQLAGGKTPKMVR